jgi:hypothetical protein
MARSTGVAVFLLAFLSTLATLAQEQVRFEPIALKSRITHVQPMTGIVLWATSEHRRTDAIQLEFSYAKYSDLVKEKGIYDWDPIDRLLDDVGGRGHQAILRFFFVYPGKEATVPDYIKALPDYRETRGTSEGRMTTFADWSHPELQRFTLEFYEQLARRYDHDRRLAFLETGFGLWAEYHIYDGPMKLGETFPTLEFQTTFAKHLATVFKATPWLISVDAAEASRAPFAGDSELLKLSFGVFDDSFLCQQHKRENEPNWNVMGRDRWKRAPAGGELSYYSQTDQKQALAPTGPHGVPFERAARDFHITFMIGDGQPRYQPMDRLRAAGLACGYKFRVIAFERKNTQFRVTVTNEGVAPIYHDAYVAVGGVRTRESLKGLLPDERRTFLVDAAGKPPRLTIESDRLVTGQRIEFEADLEGTSAGPSASFKTMPSDPALFASRR